MRRLRYVMLLAALAGALIMAQGAYAHNLWLNPEEHYPEPGQTVDIEVAWGHEYPKDRTDEEVKEDRVQRIWAQDPEGEMVELKQKSAAVYQLQVDKPGAYHIAANIEPGMFTTTPQGRKWASKQEVERPIECTAFEIMAQSVVVAGGQEQNLQASTGQPLEVILLDDPSRLQIGDTLRVRILFEGQPLSDLKLGAMYAGYSGDTGHGAQDLPVQTKTNQEGEAELELDKKGHWMILLSHRTEYPDQEVCDENTYNLALTLKIE